MSGHLALDAKMDFTRKEIWVKDKDKTAGPLGSNYAGVVSRESVRISFTCTALNNLNVWATDIQNVYIQAPTSEEHYIIYGPEFEMENDDKRAMIRRALYGGKSDDHDY